MIDQWKLPTALRGERIEIGFGAAKPVPVLNMGKGKPFNMTIRELRRSMASQPGNYILLVVLRR